VNSVIEESQWHCQTNHTVLDSNSIN